MIDKLPFLLVGIGTFLVVAGLIVLFIMDSGSSEPSGNR